MSSRFPPDAVRQLAVFAVTGLVNTLIHLLVVVALVEWWAVYPALANACAFFVANLFSFWANSRWTFATRLSFGRYQRFLLVSLLGLVVTVAASMLAQRLSWHYLFGVLLSFVCLPLLTFAAHRYWTWR